MGKRYLFIIIIKARFSDQTTKKEREGKGKRKKKRKDCACQVWPRALRKGHLKGRAPPHRPRGRGGSEVYTS
eukprot:1160311-Pelagomonas_calceolata.AAC.8